MNQKHKPRIVDLIRILTPEQAALAGVWMSPAEAKVEIAKKRREDERKKVEVIT